MHFIDVGYGDAIVVHMPGEATILVDGGYGAHETDQGRRTVLPYLQELGVTQLTAVVATHSHPDHVGGVVDVVRALPVGQVIRPAWGRTNVYTLTLDEVAAVRGVPVERGGRGIEWRWGSMRLRALHPIPGGADVADESFDLNANSLALVVEFGAARVLLLADVTTPVLRELYTHGYLPRATLIKIPHSGQRDAYDEELVRALAPQHAVLMVGPNPYSAPAPEVVSGYEAMCMLWRTDRDGTVVAELTKDGQIRVGAKGKTH
ncbi:MAG: MBL fold metallo-hydrolase [bacterium]|nr:MBL fold metallo-hydrolase [bacterium]